MRRRFSVQDRIWFTADTHFGHPAIIQHSKRMFKTTDQMDEVMMERWNERVEKDDHVFHLGDVSFHRPERTLSILAGLNGIKYLIRGNHDRNNLNSTCFSMFDGGVDHYHEITIGSQLLILCHFAFRSWCGSHHGSWNLHGHSHGTLLPIGRQIDVGVDPHDFYPWSHEEVAKYMEDKKFVRTDHHDEKRTATEAHSESGPANILEQ
jgi:calcineurin-like phosphoesterase family protein